jgi:hypothetical protein
VRLEIAASHAGGNRFCISVVSKRGRLPSVSYLVQDITDVDGSFRQPVQCHEALIFSAVDIAGRTFASTLFNDLAKQP